MSSIGTRSEASANESARAGCAIPSYIRSLLAVFIKGTYPLLEAMRLSHIEKKASCGASAASSLRHEEAIDSMPTLC